MKAIGIITEYNPFHQGHHYQTETLRENKVGDGAIIAIMSGSFTQRGEVASMDKWTRARLAIQNNVDLVLELPAIYSIASADAFALGGVHSLAGAAVIGQIAFGSEAGELKPLDEIATLLHRAEAEEDFKLALQSGLRSGQGYAAAMSAFVEGELGPEAAGLMRRANNILGISYLKAIKQLPPEQRLKAWTHERIGGEHLDSASEIRLICRSYRNEPVRMMKALEGKLPATSIAALALAAKDGSLLLSPDLSALSFSLLRRGTLDQIKDIAGMRDGLGERLMASAARLPAGSVNTDTNLSLSIYERLVDSSRARHLSQARVQRSLAALILGVTEADMQMAVTEGPQYLRVLAFNRKGRYILKQMSKYATLPIITKASDFLEHADKGDAFRRQYELDLIAADIRDSLCRDGNTGRDFDTAVYIR